MAIENTLISPASIRLEASSFCQLDCPSCPTAMKVTESHVGFGFLSFDNFKKLVDENPQIRHIELSNYGEIFLNPELDKIFEYGSKKKIVLTASNGVNLNTVKEQVLESLVKYKVKQLTISIDGVSQESYGKYRRNGRYENVIKHIEAINSWKQKYSSTQPLLRWQFVVFGHNEHEIDAARQFAEKLGMEFFLKLTWDDNFSPVKDRDHIKKLMGYSSRQEFFQQTGRIYAGDICKQLWNAPQVNWNGAILGCCRNFWGDFGGNAFSDGLLAALNNPKIRYARAMLLGKVPGREDIPCSTCEIYKTRQLKVNHD